MSKPANWKQEGPLGDADWSVTHAPGAACPVVVDFFGEKAYVGYASRQHLRDFARALDRAAAALEAAEEER